MPGIHKRLNIIDLKNKHPEKYGRFIMALKHLEESDDWSRICGIHGNTFKPNDTGVLCPTDPDTVTRIGETGEPFYCKHSVYSFIAWHTPYVYQFELLLNKYNKSENRDYITLPYLDLTDITQDFSFLDESEITIFYDKRKITISNPLASAYYYKDGVKTKTTREGFFTPTTQKERLQIKTVKKQLNNALYAINYEQFSSVPVTHKPSNIVVNYVPLETPHNQLHDIIGGDSGNMSYVDIAAFDPIFWLHHCNMDRHFYTWMYNNTDKFKYSIYPEKMLEETYEKSHAPFFTKYIYSTDSEYYNYGWLNDKSDYMILKDMLHLEKYPYTYDIIKPEPERELKAFVELIDIPIPMESMTINMYIHKNNVVLNKDIHIAGTASWFGINRKVKKCQRCEVTRTNIKIDIEDYVVLNNITINNINDYTLLLEAEGKLIKQDNNKYKTYNINEVVQDGSVEIIIK